MNVYIINLTRCLVSWPQVDLKLDLELYFVL